MHIGLSSVRFIFYALQEKKKMFVHHENVYLNKSYALKMYVQKQCVFSFYQFKFFSKNKIYNYLYKLSNLRSGKFIRTTFNPLEAEFCISFFEAHIVYRLKGAAIVGFFSIVTSHFDIEILAKWSHLVALGTKMLIPFRTISTVDNIPEHCRFYGRSLLYFVNRYRVTHSNDILEECWSNAKGRKSEWCKTVDI